MTDSEPSTPTGAMPLPRQTTPTWEIELLISGATVFGLIQLPAMVESGLVIVINRVAPDIASLLVPLWIYIQSALTILILTFIFHLCLRAYWVALVGLTSVSPGGVNWASFKKAGPYQLETSRRGREDMPAIIEAADNRASRLFGVGVGLAMALLMPMVLVTVAIIVAWLFRWLPASGAMPEMVAFIGVFVISFLPWLLATFLDRRFGTRWTPNTRRGRMLRGLLGFYARIGFGRASNLPMALYTSNTEGHRGNFIMAAASSLIIVAVSTQIVGHITDWSPTDIEGLPQFSPDAHDVIFPRHYASLRAREPNMRPVPYIPQPLVRDDYLKLFVPYRVEPHNRALAKHCPKPTESQRPARVALDCFADLHDVRIDGIKVPDLHFDASEDPISSTRGMLAMIPVHTLAKGRHELTLKPMPRESHDPADPPKPYRIPFWR
ncbi:MAG: hypothetical protein ACT4NL_15995 [Pseudomarimonas sp.]